MTWEKSLNLELIGIEFVSILLGVWSSDKNFAWADGLNDGFKLSGIARSADKEAFSDRSSEVRPRRLCG